MWRKKIVVWGTGNICSHILDKELQTQVEFFIDNDMKKVNKEIYGKKVVHPSQISNWEDFYIIIAVNNYSLIREQLTYLGLSEREDFIWYCDWLFPTNMNQIVQGAERFFEIIKEKEKNKNCKLIFSDFLAFDKGVCKFVNKWNETEKDLVLFSEAAWVSDEESNKLNIPVVKLPAVLSRNQYFKDNLKKVIDETFIDYVRGREYLKEAAANLRLGNVDMAEKYEYVICCYADKIIREIIKSWEPSQVILWNAFYAFHTIIRRVCHELDIPLKYMEFSNIPGTIIIEEIGQMGESWPARYPQKFMQIPVSDEDYNKAEHLIEDLRIQKLNRNVQPDNDLLVMVRKKLKEERPVIFYAGQNDNASGMQPYTENTKEFHSPVFKSSDEAAIYLAHLCKKNNWNYIYKPHPMMMKYCNPAELPENTILVDHVNINDLIDMSDVVVTILSTVSYIALIRRKPVVMLGYTQLKDKGCTYEAFMKKSIENKLREALKNENEDLLRRNFITHSAQMEKYYFNPFNNSDSVH